MIQDDDNIVEKKVRESAEFESLLSQEIKNAIRYNYGRELAWTFSVDLITYDGRKHPHIISFSPRWVKTNINDDFEAYVRKNIADLQDLIENNKRILETANYASPDTRNLLFVKIQINLHNDTGRR